VDFGAGNNGNGVTSFPLLSVNLMSCRPNPGLPARPTPALKSPFIALLEYLRPPMVLALELMKEAP
jgi:hypothetical protein